MYLLSILKFTKSKELFSIQTFPTSKKSRVWKLLFRQLEKHEVVPSELLNRISAEQGEKLVLNPCLASGILVRKDNPVLISVEQVGTPNYFLENVFLRNSDLEWLEISKVDFIRQMLKSTEK